MLPLTGVPFSDMVTSLWGQPTINRPLFLGVLVPAGMLVRAHYGGLSAVLCLRLVES